MKREAREWMIATGTKASTLERVERDMCTYSINFQISQLEEMEGISAEQMEENIISYLCSIMRDYDKTQYETAINTIQRTLIAVVGAVITKNSEH